MNSYDSIAVKRPVFVTVAAILCWLIATASILVAAVSLITSSTIGLKVMVFFWGLFTLAFCFAAGNHIWQMKKVTGGPMAIAVIVGGCVVFFVLHTMMFVVLYMAGRPMTPLF